MPTQYASAAKLAQLAASTKALDGVSVADQNAALLARSVFADGFLGVQFTLPLTSWSEDLELEVCALALYDIISKKPAAATNNNVYRLRFEDALSWLKRVAEGTVTPSGIVDSTPDVEEGSSVCVTNAKRGW